MTSENDERWMRRALALAQRGAEQGEVPVGAVLVRDGGVIGEGWNRPIETHDASAHAEIVAMRAAGQRMGNYRLTDSTLYVTLEPCVMCVGALIHARVNRVVYAAREPKTGAVDSVFPLLRAEQHNHRIEVLGGVLADEAAEQLRGFFRQRRAAERAERAYKTDCNASRK